MTQNKNNKIGIIANFIKNLLSPILSEESLRNLDVEAFVNVLYPIALSLILAFLVHQIAEVSWPDSFFISAIRILVTSMLILYVLFDWDDCHYAARNKKKNTAQEKILWLLAIFWLSLVTVLFIAFSTTEKLTWVLVLWLAYAVVMSLGRDPLIEIKTTSSNGTEIYTKVTQTAEYGEYKAYLKMGIIVWVSMFVAVLICGYTPFVEWIRKKVDWNPSSEAIVFLSICKCCIIYICFIGAVLLAVWLKEKRKKILFLKDDNTPQAKDTEA